MKSAGCLLALILTGTANPAIKAQAPSLTHEQQEKFLKTARIGAMRSTGEGITGSKRISMTDGVLSHDAHLQFVDIFKPVYRTKAFTETNFRDSYKYNIAAYRVAKLLGLDNTPPCVYREVDGKGASVCWWVDNVQFDEKTRRDKGLEPPDPNYWTRQLNEVRVFDQLIDNTDRTQENLLIDRDWKLWMIDHTRAFRVTYQLRKPENLRRISGALLASLRNMNEGSVVSATSPFLTSDEVKSMMVRRDLLLKFFQGQINEKGREAVLTDLPVKTPAVTVP